MPEPPKPTPTPVNTMPPQETAAQMAARLAGQTTAGESETDIIRQWMRDQGIYLPTTLGDVYNLSARIKALYDEADRLDTQAQAGGHGIIGEVMPALRRVGMLPAAGLAKRQEADALKNGLYALAGEYFGTQGQTIVSRTLRPPTPSVEQLPTAEEFLSDYNTAFATHIEGMKGGLTNEEVSFANEVLKNQTYQEYMAKLGEFAKAGMSPFTLQEITREQRGIGTGTAAGTALEKALGPGVTEPTTVTGTAEEVSKAIDVAGQGIPKEFTSVARLSPLDFLEQTLTPESIKIAYAGSAQGAGRTSRQAPAGYVATPRRV